MRLEGDIISEVQQEKGAAVKSLLKCALFGDRMVPEEALECSSEPRLLRPGAERERAFRSGAWPPIRPAGGARVIREPEPPERIRVGGLAEERFEAGLDKVVIVGQSGGDALGFHDLETGAVGEAPVLVGAPFVALKRLGELLRGLWKHDYSVAFACVFDSVNCDGTHNWAAVTERV